MHRLALQGVYREGSLTECTHRCADVGHLIRGGRFPSCHAILTPEEVQELADAIEAEEQHWRLMQLRADLDDLERRISKLEELRTRVTQLEKDYACKR